MRRGHRKAEHPATARRILAAAEQHFAARGLAGARTEEIATAAHANKAMLYYYFRNKRGLHRAVLENLLRQFRAGVLAPPGKGLSPRDQFFAYVSNYFDFLATHPNYPRLVQRASLEASRNIDWMAREYFRPLHQRLAGAIARGIAAKEFRKAALITLGMATSYFAAAPIMTRVVGRNMLAPRAVAARKRAVLDFLVHGLVRKGAMHR
jgi:TetR/AcrR family transcriptional regulator